MRLGAFGITKLRFDLDGAHLLSFCYRCGSARWSPTCSPRHRTFAKHRRRSAAGRRAEEVAVVERLLRSPEMQAPTMLALGAVTDEIDGEVEAGESPAEARLGEPTRGVTLRDVRWCRATPAVSSPHC